MNKIKLLGIDLEKIDWIYNREKIDSWNGAIRIRDKYDPNGFYTFLLRFNGESYFVKIGIFKRNS